MTDAGNQAGRDDGGAGQSIRPLPFPGVDAAAEPRGAERERSLRMAVLLTVLFGPLGLFYVSPLGGLLMTMVTLTAGLFTMGVALLFAWPFCILWATAATITFEEPALGERL
jgi:hypothetical protein